jgi:autotransporter-associated beta strand protein
MRIRKSSECRISKSVLKTLGAISCVALGSSPAWGQLVSFPGAQGYGKYTTGGRNGNLYVVTNLNATGPGSFENGVQNTSNTIIVFAVGGTIDLSQSISAKTNVTILGQTAPGQGITLEGWELSFAEQANVDLQYIRVREGTQDTDTNNAAINLGDVNGAILDHVSAEFSGYDNIDAVGSSSRANDITYQNDLVADGIHSQYFNLHEEGSLPVTFLNDVFANSNGRSPLVKDNAQFVDNVVYDYAYAYTTGNSSGHFKYDIINNYFIAGISTTTPSQAFYQLTSDQSAYASGNYLDSNKNGVLDGSPVVPETSTSVAMLSSEWSTETQFLPTVSAAAAYAFDSTHAGDSATNSSGAGGALPNGPTLGWDQLDTSIMGQVQSLGTSGKVINEPDDDGMPAGPGTLYFGTTNGGSWSFACTSGDDIPDVWAEAHGMNTASFAQATYKNALGYDMIEQYAQQMGDTYNYQEWTSASGDWTTGTWNSPEAGASETPSYYDHAVIAGGGTVSIGAGDAAQAFNIAIGGTGESLAVSIAGSGGETLNVTGGSLYVQDTIYVGDQANATFNMSGGTVMCNNVLLGNSVWNQSGVATNYTGTFNFTGGTLQAGQVLNGVGAPSPTGSLANWTSGGNWFWSGGTLEAWGNINVNAPATLGDGGATVDTVGPDGVTYTGVMSGVLSGTGGFTKVGAGSLTLSAHNTYTGNTTVKIGGILDVTGSLAANGSSNVFIDADASGATQLVRFTPLNTSYDGLGSSVTSGLQSSADIVSGASVTNNPSANKSVAMQWRLRTTPEQSYLLSEVISITGQANSGTTGTGQTDPYALQMSFNPTGIAPYNEGGSAAAGAIYLSWLNSSSVWVNATAGDFATGPDLFTNVQSSWSAFATANGITDANIGNFLGSWGVDVADNDVWAVVDHDSSYSTEFNSSLAVIPEPSAAVLALASCGLLLRRRRRTA